MPVKAGIGFELWDGAWYGLWFCGVVVGVGSGERTPGPERDCSAGRAVVMVSNWASVRKPRSARASSSWTAG